MIELFSENLDPGPEEVAKRSGLSPRSVYRYFEDRDALLQAAIDRQVDMIAPLFAIHDIGQGHLDDRIDEFVAVRVRTYEAAADGARAARLRAPFSEMIRERVEMTRRIMTEQVDRQFATELEVLGDKQRRSKAAAVDALCQFEALDHYRVHRGFSATATRTMMADALHDLLDPDGTRSAADGEDDRR